jgi:hypothetical protein
MVHFTALFVEEIVTFYEVLWEFRAVWRNDLQSYNNISF